MRLNEYQLFWVKTWNDVAMELVPEEEKWLVWECIKKGAPYPKERIANLTREERHELPI